MKRDILGVTLLSLLLGGCEKSSSLGEYLEVTLVNNTVQIDTVCANGGCEELVLLTFSLRLEHDTALAENDQVAFEQYRVDYSPAGLSKKMPYFAGTVEVVVHNNSEATVSLQVVGSKQREFLYAQVGDREIVGTARLTLAGYDEKDERVDFEFGFNMQFGDFVAESPSPIGEE